MLSMKNAIRARFKGPGYDPGESYPVNIIDIQYSDNGVNSISRNAVFVFMGGPQEGQICVSALSNFIVEV